MGARTAGARWYLALVLLALLVLGASGSAQKDLPSAPEPQQTVPDAPSATRPFPKPQADSGQSPALQPSQQPADSPQPRQSAAGPETQVPTVTDTPNRPNRVDTVPPGSVPRQESSPRDQLFTLTKSVNFVVVPVTVKDDAGHLVEGLLPKDFDVQENGQPQRITFFTSDPFPLTAAVVIDLGMPDIAVQKIDETMPALIGAFGQFDEIAVYAYNNTVSKVQDFTPATGELLSLRMKKFKRETRGQNSTAPVVGGPFGSAGPTINGRTLEGAPADTTAAATYRPESRVLNDAILEAALDLSRRTDPRRRKVLFVISDGRERGSDASYEDVRRVLLGNQITLYALAVDSGALPVYKQLGKIPFPGSRGDLLAKYASATGGQVLGELSKGAIEQAYSQITQEARNQYTLGYFARSTPSTAYRSIEVLVHRPDLRVYAKDGYFPLPPPH